VSTPGSARTLRLFDGYGIELEYMIVDGETLAVLPLSDEVLRAVCGEYAGAYEDEAVAWSNELVLHVIELKTNGPTPSLGGWAERFQAAIHRINCILSGYGARLMPTAMHPTMNPDSDTRLWPHEHSAVYLQYERIFGCRGHGWSNLQSCHLNLPFHGDEEFGRLHAAVRLVLPLLPALAASSPVVDGRASGILDNRLEAYRLNQARIPSITGQVVPEPVFTAEEYRRRILGPMYADVAPLDPAGVLQHEFLNSRGAIARFDRSAIEIRMLDVQEAPVGDLAIASLVTEVLKALVNERWAPMERLQRFGVEPLAAVMLQTIRDAEDAVVGDRDLLTAFGMSSASCRAGNLWKHLANAVAPVPSDGGTELHRALDVILDKGCLARRILTALGAAPSRERIASTYAALCECLADGRLFLGETGCRRHL
jgi:gamma-glutamyl:cysteine ligase YbdK (ATP-grasp superfamily)